MTVLMVLALNLWAAAADEGPVQRDVRIPMRDGKWLSADVYRPPAAGKYPTILVQTPYSKGHFAAPSRDPGAAPARNRELRNPTFSEPFGREHYAWVVVDWRGFFKSKPAIQGVRRPNRGFDGYDCVEWIAAQPWSNTKVGTWGPSALGKVQFDTAMAKPPHLVCAAPAIAAMGTTYDQYYENGVLHESRTRVLDALGFGVGDRVRAASDPDSPMWRFAERLSVRPQDVEVPVLMISGWYDHFPAAILRTFDDLRQRAGPATREHSRLLIGPWDHLSVGQTRQGDREYPAGEGAALVAARAFFDYWLRGVGEEPMAEAALRYQHMGEGRWVDAASFPGVPVRTEVLYLSGSGRSLGQSPPDDKGPGALATESPQGAEQSGTLAKEPAAQQQTLLLPFDPARPTPTLGGANLPPLRHGPTDHRRLLGREDVLAFGTGPLSEPLRLAGSPTLLLRLRSDTVSADLALRLLERTPSGEAFLIGDSIARFEEDGDSPRDAVQLEISTPPIALTIPAGHELVLVLSGTNSPRYEPNTGDGSAHFDAKLARAGVLSLILGGPDGARLELPVLQP